MTDAPVATRYTCEFVRRRLHQAARNILEIGCGTGELAAELQKDGLAVTAIDSDAECVAAAAERGLDARQLVWPAQLEGQFDAILFTRSLHHVVNLQDGVAAARSALRAGGQLIVEDFHAEGGSARSNEWYCGLTRTLAASDAFTDDFNLEERLVAAEPDHDHRLHSSGAIEEAIRFFGRIESEKAAYYFRYLEGQFRHDSANEELLRHELALIELGSIDALGKRFVAYDG